MRAKNLIVSVDAPLARFIKESRFFDGAEDIGTEYMQEYLDTVIDQVLKCIAHEPVAISQLWDYARKLKHREDDFYTAQEQYVRIAKAAISLGEALLDQLKEMKAYDAERRLSYEFTGRLGQDALLLERTRHLPTKEEIGGQKFLILDTTEGVKQYLSHTSGMEGQRDELMQFMVNLPDYVNETKAPQVGLNNYLRQLQLKYQMFNAPEDGDRLVRGANALGEQLLDNWQELGLFKQGGKMHYQFNRWLDQNSPIFEKCPAFIG